MRKFNAASSLAIAAALLCAAPGSSRAAEIEKLPQRVFDVVVQRGATPSVEVTFALAMSEVRSYPVSVVAISGSVEELLYEGSLDEGLYRLRAPLTKISSGALKIVLRTRVTNRTTQGPENFIRYVTWEGSI